MLLDCATCSRQSCARFVYTLPTSLEGRRTQASRPLSGHKKKEDNLSIVFFVPPQVVPVTRCVPGVPDFILIV